MSESMAHDSMMADMGMHMPWTLTDLWVNFVMWTVMMIGMMAGSAVPVLLLFAGATAARGASRIAWPVLMLFGAGYLAVWTGFSALAVLAQWRLHEATLLSPAMAAASPRLAGAILIAAGAYQVTPAKGACLAHCRTPIGFLMGHWRDGLTGALQMGARHGLYCLGCCWALMCVLFAVGVMNLLWVAALAVFVLIEKTGPAGLMAGRIGGIALLVFGALVAAGVVVI